ncbi:MAG: hypothetical protein NXI12_13965 [Alphaproteobacteria bacterium]|nr:hypothetical protein [Alphaproteobacteria bacterium]
MTGFAASAPFAGQLALVATLHGKEAALAPALEALGFEVRVAEGLDTDRFGTFTGEVERTGSMLDAAREKARAAFALAGGADWVFASEGAFGSSGAIPILAEGKELILAWRPADGLEVTVLRPSFETNFAHLQDPDAPALDAFLERAGFPDHAVIVKARGAVLAKGVQDRAALERLIAQAEGPAKGPVRVETDMRAHLNPTRMGEIARAAEELAKRLASPCPSCAAPGFGLTRVERGLPCTACKTPTDRVIAEINACPGCGHEARMARADGLKAADPGECPACNP